MTEEYLIPEVQISGNFLAQLDEIYVPLPSIINVVNPDYPSDHESYFEFPSDFVQDPISPYSFLQYCEKGGNDSDQRLRYYNLFKSRQDAAKVISDKELIVVNKAHKASSLVLAKAEWKALVTNKNILMAECNQHIAEAKRKLTLLQGE